MSDHQRLEFRRQFLLTKLPIEPLAGWSCLKIGQYFLYAHPDLEVTKVDGLNKGIVLIGSIFNPAQPTKRNIEIIQDIYDNIQSREELFLNLKQYAGRYAILFKNNENIIILQDALALREVYYCTKDNRVVCGSQPNLIVKYGNPEIQARKEQEFQAYYKKNSINGKWNPYRKWIGDETYYEGIKHLLPNHFLDISRREVGRYWPNETVRRLNLDEAVSLSCSFLQGSIEAIMNRHPVMMAVTAGTDSRTLLAASREFLEKIYFFINDEQLGNKHPDISIPKKIFERFGIPFHIQNIPNDVDDEFREIFLNNTFFASERIIATIYNYFRNHTEKVNLIGIGEIGRTRYGRQPKNLNIFRMLYKIIGHGGGLYELRQAETILSELQPVGKAYGLNVLTLLYWEHALGNWGVTGNSESDIAIEEFNPFDSHQLYETLLGVDEKLSRIKKSTLFIEMIRNMWPELLEWPLNPPYTTRDKIKEFLYKIGVFGIIKELKYRVSYLRYIYQFRNLKI